MASRFAFIQDSDFGAVANVAQLAELVKVSDFAAAAATLVEGSDLLPKLKSKLLCVWDVSGISLGTFLD